MKKQGKQGDLLVKRILICGLAGIAASLILSMTAALLVLHQILPQSAMEILPPVISAAAVFICALFGCRGAGSDRFLIGLGAGAVFFALSLAGKVVFFPGQAAGIWRNVLISLAAGLAASLLAAGKRKPRRNRRGK